MNQWLACARILFLLSKPHEMAAFNIQSDGDWILKVV